MIRGAAHFGQVVDNQGEIRAAQEELTRVPIVLPWLSVRSPGTSLQPGPQSAPAHRKEDQGNHQQADGAQH